jgi:TolB-like protein/tetratricopeptide (TPR) repeat protein
MKRCPQCKRVYRDETMLFCLDDGNPLLEEPTSDQSPTAFFQRSREPTPIVDGVTRPLPGVRASTPPAASIAVLPFAHLSKDPDDEYFCDGMAEELINALARVEELKVVARTSTFSFKGKNVPVSEIGSSLNVQHVVEGSVRKFGERMRITVHLVNVTDGYQLWSGKFDTEMRDLFEVQDEITTSVVSALRTKLLEGHSESQRGTRLPNLKNHIRDMDSYQHYLRGRYFLNKLTSDDLYRAIECFNQALAIDENFAPAYAGQAEAHVCLTEFGPVPSLEGLPRAKEAALKAISLDNNLSEAHGSLALVLQEYDFDFSGAEAEYLIAIELNPNNAISHEYYGSLLAQMGRHAEAEAQCLKAIDLDPLSPIGAWFYPMALYLERRYDDAVRASGRVLELDANFSATYLILSFIHQARSAPEESASAFLRFTELCGMADFAVEARNAFNSDGWEGYLRTMTSVEARSHLPAYFVAASFVGLGDTEAALWSIEDSYARREGFIVLLNTDPRFDPLRSEPRFQAVIRKIGFPA